MPLLDVLTLRSGLMGNAGIVTLADKFRNTCFVHGISSYTIQTTVCRRNGKAFDENAERDLKSE
jgi:hypothetical protein